MSVTQQRSLRVLHPESGRGAKMCECHSCPVRRVLESSRNEAVHGWELGAGEASMDSVSCDRQFRGLRGGPQPFPRPLPSRCVLGSRACARGCSSTHHSTYLLGHAGQALSAQGEIAVPGGCYSSRGAAGGQSVVN